MRVLVILFVLSIPYLALGQSHNDEVLAFQQELNHEFLDPNESPLTAKDREQFSGHNFFPIEEEFRVVATFTKTANPVAFTMQTTTDRLPVYDPYGQVTFELKGKTFTLTIYQSHQLRETKEYKNYLFLPFTDLTNSEETYGGGRYIDLMIPEGNTIVIDFNKAYSPSCAYNYVYSCPIPPRENHMDVRITAGVKNLELPNTDK